MHSRALSGNRLLVGGHLAVDMVAPHTLALTIEVERFRTRHLLVGALLMLV
jgi:hypothetical protein